MNFNFRAISQFVVVATMVSICGADEGYPAFNEILKQYVSAEGVDYEGLKSDEKTLVEFLNGLNPKEIAKESNAAKLAFWINAYNAVALKSVLENWPVKSVKDIKGFFDKNLHSIGRWRLTLEDIEKTKINPLKSYKAYFALCPGTRGAPVLRSEAYTEALLEAQLEDQLRRFLADDTRGLRAEPKAKILFVSGIFNRHADLFRFSPYKDFAGDVIEPVGLPPQVPTRLTKTLAGQRWEIKEMPMDWTLNSAPPVREEEN